MKILLYEAPVDDFLSDDAKLKILGAQNRKYQKAKEEGGSSNKMGELMYSLPNLEREYKSQLISLALAIFYNKFPKIKERVDNGTLKMDVELTSSPSGRISSQKVDQQKIEKAKEVDPNFDERVKARNFINATTQGVAWSEGFNGYKEIENQLNQLNPELVNKYKQFENSATVFYNDNTEALERMAERSSGRVAYTDLVPDNSRPGNWILIVRAPHFPLLLHELYKGGRYYNSVLYTPKDKNVSNTLKDITDTHKHEIRNMITGREISSKLRFLWGELVYGYETWMDGLIQTQFNKLANDNPKLFNEIMYDGVLSGKPAAMDKFEKYSQKIVDAIIKNPPKVETPDYNKIIQPQKKVEPIEPEEDDDDENDDDEDDDSDFNPDDWEVYHDDDDEDK
jgi:hypothetical protein